MARLDNRRCRGQVALAICVAVAAVSLLIAGLALWRSHEAHLTARQALQAHEGSGDMRAMVEQLLAQTPPPVPFTPQPAPSIDGPTGPTTTQLVETAMEGLIGEEGQEAITDGGVVIGVEPAQPATSAEPDPMPASAYEAERVTAANGESVLAMDDEQTTPLPPTPHRWDGPRAPQPSAGAIIPWDEAADHYSRTITVEGEVVATGKARAGHPVYLNFQPYSPNSKAFHIVIFEDGFGNAPDGDPFNYYKGKTVRVRGEVSQYRDAPQIKVERSGMIEVVN
ncbi:MAG: hypothetical protein AAGK09_06645 [Planctomycetota bacterium]